MTIDEARDRIAVLLGWTSEMHDGIRVWILDGRNTDFHPVPDTIDGLLEMMPKGTDLQIVGRMSVSFSASGFDSRGQYLSLDRMFPTAYEAMLRLLLAVLEKENTR